MKQNGNKAELPVKAILIGVIFAVIISIVLLSIVTALTVGGRVGEERIHIFLYMITAASSVAGGLLGVGLSGKKGIVPLVVGVIYWILLLLIGMLFFDGVFQNVWIPLLFAGIGSGTVCATCMKKTSRKGYKKLRPR